MANILGLDAKTVAAVSVAIAAGATGVAAYSTYKYISQIKKNQKENVYETEKLLNEYLLLHYGSPKDCMLWDFGPRDATDFPKRCAELCIKYFDSQTKAPRRALDVGCAVGRSSFELSRLFGEVVGVDYSANFIAACDRLKEDGHMTYTIATEGQLDQMHVARVDPSLNRQGCRFEVGDACCLSADLKQFGCVMAANLICRLPYPDMFLLRCSDLVAKGGILVITSPYTFMPEYTAYENMIGGYIRNGKEYTGFDGLKTILGHFFDLIGEEDMPFLIRETRRKHQWTVAHATIWRRK